MQSKSRWSSVLIAATLATTAAWGQTPHQPRTAATDLAITYSTERAKLQSSACSCFWLNGGSVDGAVTFYHGFGVAANLTAEHASNISPGVNLGKFSFLLGPRYTFSTSRHPSKHNVRIFTEALFGGAHGFDSVFPSSTGAHFSAGSFSTQLGVGADVALHKGFGLRLFEVDYVRTSLPNNGSNSQNDLRLAFGLSYRLQAH